MRCMSRSLVVITMVAVAVAGLAGTPAAMACVDEPADVLGGPKVAAPVQKKSLVRRDSEGRLIVLERQPAEAALALLELDEKSKAKAQQVLVARSKAMDAFLQENLLEVGAAANAFASGQTQEGLRQVMLLRGRSPALRGREKLTDELAASLGKKHGDELKALVKEYWEAIAKEGAEQGQREAQMAMGEGSDGPADKDASDDEQTMNPVQRGLARAGGGGAAIAREALRLLGEDIKAAYERTILSQANELEDSLKRLNLKPEQESRVRAHIQEAFSQAAEKKPTEATRKAAGTRAFLKIWQELDTGQKQELMKIMREKGYVK